MHLGLSHLNKHKFKHGFNDRLNPIYIWGGDLEFINHFFLHYSEYCEVSLTHLPLYGDPKSNSSINAFILNSATEFILSLVRFNGPLLNKAYNVFCSFSDSFFIWLSLSFCLFIPFIYLSFVLISQVLETFYIWFSWLLGLL